MNSMRRDEVGRSVAPVKEDPHLIVEQLRALEQAISLLREDDRDDQRTVSVLDRLRHYFLTDLLAHLQEEERDFIPAVKSLPGGEGKAARLWREHGELRQRIADFKSALTLTAYVGAESRAALLWRLVTEARGILTRLKTHAAYEYDLVRELNGMVRGRQSTAS